MYVAIATYLQKAAKQKQPGCKKIVKPIRSSIANGHN